MLHTKHLIPTLTLLLGLLLSFTASSCKRPTATQGRMAVSVSIEPLRYVVEAIGGDKVEAHTIMPQGASPETYEPTPRQMMELSSSRLLFRAGTLGFEQTSLPRMASNAPDVEMVDLAKGIRPIYDENHSHATSHGESDSMDPHTWMSTDNLRIMASNACHALCEADSTNAPYFRQRLNAFNNRMDSLDTQLSTWLKPIEHRAFLIYHPALGYFARQYGLHQLSVEHDGKEPSVARMNALITACRNEGVRVVFVSKEHVGRAARRIAKELNLKLVTINPLSYDLEAQMESIAKALKQ